MWSVYVRRKPFFSCLLFLYFDCNNGVKSPMRETIKPKYVFFLQSEEWNAVEAPARNILNPFHIREGGGGGICPEGLWAFLTFSICKSCKLKPPNSASPCSSNVTLPDNNILTGSFFRIFKLPSK